MAPPCFRINIIYHGFITNITIHTHPEAIIYLFLISIGQKSICQLYRLLAQQLPRRLRAPGAHPGHASPEWLGRNQLHLAARGIPNLLSGQPVFMPRTNISKDFLALQILERFLCLSYTETQSIQHLSCPWNLYEQEDFGIQSLKQQPSSAEFTTQPLTTIQSRMSRPPPKALKSYTAPCISHNKHCQIFVTYLQKIKSVYPKGKKKTKRLHRHKIQPLGMTVKCQHKPNLQNFTALETETLNYQHLYISIKYQVNFVFNY